MYLSKVIVLHKIVFLAINDKANNQNTLIFRNTILALIYIYITNVSIWWCEIVLRIYSLLQVNDDVGNALKYSYAYIGTGLALMCVHIKSVWPHLVMHEMTSYYPAILCCMLHILIN